MRQKICLVDDTPDLLLNLTEFLEMEGYEVWPCQGGTQALERMAGEIPDLVITDLWMPELDGLMLIGKFKKETRLKDVPVIIFSARPLEDYEDQARDLGVYEFIKKPSPLEYILKVVNDYLPEKH